MLNRNPYFINQAVFTDKRNYSRDGIFYFHNNHFYTNENPHMMIQNRKFSINVWAGIVGNLLIGPAVLSFLCMIVHQLVSRVAYNWLNDNLDGTKYP